MSKVDLAAFLGVACVGALMFVIWVVSRLAAIERELRDEREYRQDLRDKLYKTAGEAREAYAVLGLVREPSTPERWVKER